MASYEHYHPSLDDSNAWVPYRYYPTLPAASVLAIIFGLLTSTHGFVMIRSRGTFSMVPFIVGGIFELAGYIGRCVSSQDIWALGAYIVQSILLLVAPALFAASIYMILGTIVRTAKAEKLSPIPPKWLTKVFVMGDVIAFLLQMCGGGIQAVGTLEYLDIGEKIIVAGLFAQIIFFGFFVVVAGVAHNRVRSSKSSLKQSSSTAWQTNLYSLYMGSGLIMLRSVFRVIEYLMGNNGFLLRHEYFLYIFDALPMVLLMVLFLVVHPNRLPVPARKDISEAVGDADLAILS